MFPEPLVCAQGAGKKLFHPSIPSEWFLFFAIIFKKHDLSSWNVSAIMLPCNTTFWQALRIMVATAASRRANV
jgi:hypothetical protein